MITETKEQKLAVRMDRLGIRENDLIEKFIRGSGAGGQKINKTSMCVWIKHRPTGIEVKCQESRSQSDNRFFARRLLVEKIEGKILGERSERTKKIEKLRRQKRRRSRRAKEKMLDQKKRVSHTKEMRKKPRDEG